jgi:hypothetical protein
VSCHVELPFPPLESTLSPIISSCSLLRQLSISAANVVANQVSLRQPQGADHPGWIRPLPVPLGVLAVILCCWETPRDSGGTTSNHPCTQSQHLAFAAVGGDMPQGHSLSSLSQSTLSLSQHSAGAIHAVATRRTKNQGRKGTCPVYDKHGNKVIDDNKYVTMRKIIFQSPMLCVQHQPWTLRERHSLLPRQQN